MFTCSCLYREGQTRPFCKLSFGPATFLQTSAANQAAEIRLKQIKKQNPAADCVIILHKTIHIFCFLPFRGGVSFQPVKAAEGRRTRLSEI